MRTDYRARHATTKRPEGYRQCYTIDLQQDKTTALYIDLLSLGTMVVMALIMHQFISIRVLFSMQKGFGVYSLRFTVMFLGMFGYISLHELTRGAAMRYYSREKVDIGFSGLYAYAGCRRAFFDRHAYVRITLAPLVIWGLVFLIINLLVREEWIWVIYMLQITNVSGAAGDWYIVWQMHKQQGDVLVMDDGACIRMYGSRAGVN